MRFPRCTANCGDPGSGQTMCSGIAATWKWLGSLAPGRERTFAWLNQLRRLRVRYEKRVDIREAFLSLRCALVCWQSLRKTWRTA